MYESSVSRLSDESEGRWARDECEVSVFINGGRVLQYVTNLDAAEEAVFMSFALRHLETENEILKSRS